MRTSGVLPTLDSPLAGLGDARLPSTPCIPLTAHGADILRRLEIDGEDLLRQQICKNKPIQMVVPIHTLENMQLEQQRLRDQSFLDRLTETEGRIAAAVATRLGFESTRIRESYQRDQDLALATQEAGLARTTLANVQQQHAQDIEALGEFLHGAELRAKEVGQMLRMSDEKNQRLSKELEGARAQVEVFRAQLTALEHECFVLRSRLWVVDSAAQEQVRQRSYENSVLQDELNLMRCHGYGQKASL